MIKFCKYNENPKGRKTTDCVTRALTSACGIPYVDVLRLQYEFASKRFYAFDDKRTYEGILEMFGYKKMKQPRKENGKKYTVGELDEILTWAQMYKEGVFVTISGHCTYIYEGTVWDTWDCRDYTVCNYYVKGE